MFRLGKQQLVAVINGPHQVSHQQASVCCLQSSGEPHNLAQQEAARRDALAKQDPAAVRRQEMYIIATLLNSQFGPARVDEEQGLVLLEVGCCTCQ